MAVINMGTTAKKQGGEGMGFAACVVTVYLKAKGYETIFR